MSDTQVTAPKRNSSRKIRVGTVISDKMAKTVTVKVAGKKRHPLYGKTIPYSKKFKAHDANSEAHMGDLVEIMETRPLSKTKRWRLLRVVEKKNKGEG